MMSAGSLLSVNLSRSSECLLDNLSRTFYFFANIAQAFPITSAFSSYVNCTSLPWIIKPFIRWLNHALLLLK